MNYTFTEPGKYSKESRENLISRITRLYRENPFTHEVVKRIHELAKRLRSLYGDETIKIMDFCGTHEWTITHYGIRSLMPENVELVAGPGCPVCITPGFYVDVAVKLSLEGIKVYTYGDVYKLPGTTSKKLPRSLAEARAQGGKVEVIYSLLDAVKRFKALGEKEAVFLAVGFETTAPSTASVVTRHLAPKGFRFIVVHRLTPPIMRYVFKRHAKHPIKGVIAPGHVSTITGAKAWEFVATEFNTPVVVAGFEPLDVLLAILEILRQLLEGKARIVNEYSRVVTWEGNVEAQKSIRECFEVVDAAWRGLGFVEKSGLKLREKFMDYDALEHYGIRDLTPQEFVRDIPPGCMCAAVTLGLAKPTDCPHFLRRCTPSNPYGPCMVSSEGTCSIWARYGGGGIIREIAKSIVSLL